MIQNILAENSTSSQQSFLINDAKFTPDRHTIARVEMNFEKLPIWSPKPKRATVFTASKTIELEPEKLATGQLVSRSVEVAPSAKYGYPTTQTQEYWCALQMLWHESPTRDTGRIEFSRRQIIEKILGKKFGKSTVKALELALQQLAGTLFKFEYSFYDKEREEKHEEVKGFTLLTSFHLTSKKSKEEIVHDKCSVTLHPMIVSNLRSGFFKPILLSIVANIKSDIARLLYSKLDTQFSYYAKYEISSERFFKEHGLQGTEYGYPSTRKRLLEKATKELIGKPTSSGAIIDRYEFLRTADGKDWKLIVRAKKGKSLLGKKTKKKETEEIIQSLIKDETKPNLEQQSFSFEEAKKTDNVVVPPTENSNSKVKTDSSLSSKIVEEILEHFRKLFFDGNTDFEFTKKDRTKASDLIKKYGFETTKSIISKAKTQTDKDKFYPKTLAGLGKYFNDALKQIEEERTIATVQKIQSDISHKQNIEEQRYKHEKEYSAQYYEYVEKVLKAMVLALPEECQAFHEGEAQKLSQLQQEIENAPSKQKKIPQLKLRTFNRIEQKLCRAVDFFKDKEIQIPDFWQWDKEHNLEGLHKRKK